jgi:hypothetical protein
LGGSEDGQKAFAVLVLFAVTLGHEFSPLALFQNIFLQIAARRATATNYQELPKTFRNLYNEIA